ncbi:hypothetical protein Tco_1484997 [Tanacetum coccineum]
MGDTIDQTSSENVSKHSNDLLLSGKDSIKLEELMKLCTNLKNRVLDLDHTKTTQALKIDRLKRRGDQEDASKQDRKMHDIDEDEDIYLVNVPRDEDMFGINDLEGDEVIVESDVAAKKKDDKVNVVEEVVSTAGDVAAVSAATITAVELTLAQTLAELKSARPRAKGLVIPEKEPSESITTTTTKTTAGILLQEPSETRTTTTPTIPSKDKGKSIMVEEPLKMKKKDEDKVEIDYELAQRLQQEEQEELTIEEKSKLLQQLLKKRRKHFAAKRAEERRNKPPTKAQQRSIMWWEMLKDFDKEDLETLWRLVKAKHGYTWPEEGYKRVLWGDLKTSYNCLKIKTAERVSTVKGRIKTEEKIKIAYEISNIFSEALRKSGQVYQNLMENSLALNHKLDELIESLKSLLEETNKEDLAKHKFREQ